MAIRASGKDPIFSDWITIQEIPHTLPLWVQRALRSVRGRVVDRQGKAVAGAQVFQSGDGPDRTETTTLADGQFSLDGFRQGPVFVFVRSAGFRFHGQLVKPADGNVMAELTRDDERPAREMKMVQDLISADESRALARRVLEPCWKVVTASGTDSAKYNVLNSLLPADPASVLQKLEGMKFTSDVFRLRLLREAVLAFAERDQEEAAALAESITDTAEQALALIQLSDKIPQSQRERKLELLDRAERQARIATGQGDRLKLMGEVGERWYELGQIDKAKALFAEAKKIADQFNDKTDFERAGLRPGSRWLTCLRPKRSRAI